MKKLITLTVLLILTTTTSSLTMDNGPEQDCNPEHALQTIIKNIGILGFMSGIYACDALCTKKMLWATLRNAPLLFIAMYCLFVENPINNAPNNNLGEALSCYFS